jgi:hypothetical protein
MWEHRTEDFRALIYCTEVDGVATRYFTLNHNTHGSASLKQVVTDPCPEPTWTQDEIGGSITSIAVTDFAEAEDCNPCSITAYNTGQESSGSPPRDQHWDTQVVGDDAYLVTTPSGAWATAPADTAWIAHAANPVSAGPFDYDTTITIPVGVDLDQLHVPLSMAADNRIYDILVNGDSTGITHEGFNPLGDYYIPPGLWVSGSNTIRVRCQDDGAVGGFIFKWGTPYCQERAVCDALVECPDDLSITVEDAGDVVDGTATLSKTGVNTWADGGTDSFSYGDADVTFYCTPGEIEGDAPIFFIRVDFGGGEYLLFRGESVVCPADSIWNLIENTVPGTGIVSITVS